MLKTIIVLPDGTELSSGINAENAILSVVIQECVNESQELTLGSTCANRLEAKIRVPSGTLAVAAGQEVMVYKADMDGTRHPIGLFTLEKPVWASTSVMKLTAYDRVSWLDKDLTDWVNGFAEWPMDLYSFAKEVCEACNLTLANENIPNGDYVVRGFSGSNVTGRQLIRWVGQAAGRFARATPEGEIDFSWYTPVDIPITPDGDLFYYQNGLSYADYQTAPIEKIQIHLTEDDVGMVWPNGTESLNSYIMTGNYLLTSEEAADLLGVAQTLLPVLETVSYTPCKVACPIDLNVKAGSIVQVTDRNGRQFQTYVMTRTISGQRMTLECTGSYRRDSTGAVNETGFKALHGKVLELKTGVEGILVENRDTAGKIAKLQGTVDGLSTTVSSQAQDLDKARQDITEISQTANQVKIDVATILEEGAGKVKTGKGYTFDDRGMEITDHQSDISNTINHEGMYVNRGRDTMLKADKDGVIATDVRVNNYLSIGHSRFEAYSDGIETKRTACFFTEEGI